MILRHTPSSPHHNYIIYLANHALNRPKPVSRSPVFQKYLGVNMPEQIISHRVGGIACALPPSVVLCYRVSAILESFPFLSLCSKHTGYLYVRKKGRRREGLPLKRLCIETSSHPERLENLFEVDQVRFCLSMYSCQFPVCMNQIYF